jgi:hypothetical protein
MMADTPNTDDQVTEEAANEGGGFQINENTVDDPETPEAVPGDDHLHSRNDVPKRDQGIQINENTIADEE